mgnify:CR=1 FL=1
MKKSQYAKVAKIFASVRASATGESFGTVLFIESEIAMLFAREDPSFDVAKFYTQCRKKV